MKIIIKDNNDSVTCRLCGEQCKRIYGKHLKFKHNNMSTDEYKKLFPGASIMALSDKEKTSKNSGLHMKDEKYKIMFSEKIKGEKNPNHRLNTTEEERKKRSPFSKKFKKYENVENIEDHISKFAKNAIKDRIHSTSLEYFLNKGFNEEEAKIKLSERQNTFSLEKCIKKYGEKDGLKRWKDRQKKWLLNYKKINYSNISQELFINLYKELIDINFNDKVYFAKLDNNNNIHNTNKNYEFRLNLKESYILPDFFIPSLNLIIEFDGVYYHRNTIENKKRKDIRHKNIIESGFDVIYICEKEFKKDKEKTINDLLKLILKKKLSINV
jgi:very-short-patch-repair endonuclease